ncbi:MAG: hypothetical protein ACRBEQ_00610 [Hyphomonas sp.]
MLTSNEANSRGAPRLWFWIGIVLLAYSAAGNWLVLPGYRRFLEHGSPNAGQPGVDFALIWGAARTILWMLSFHLGALCLALSALSAQTDATPRFRRLFLAGGALWIGLWMIPEVPGPFSWFFACTGLVILAAIIVVFYSLALPPAGKNRSAAVWRIPAYFFFALATWDMCGLGSVGGILHSDSVARRANQGLVVAQTSKLIVELAMAWLLLARAEFTRAEAKR